MKHVGIREFRDQATTLIAGNETLVIERHGKPVGFYIPLAPSDKARLYRSLDRLEEAVQRVLAETGLTEDELAEALTVRR